MIKLNKPQLKIVDRNGEAGFAAFAVTLILMIVLSLIVLGFAANSRDEQQRALDTQLSTAAYYAAESGINDAYNIIKADFQNGVTVAAQYTCNGGAYSKPTPPTNILAPTGVTGTQYPSYACLLVNPSPPSLEYTPITTGHGQVVPLFGVDGNNKSTAINSIGISWQEDGVAAPTFKYCPASGSDSFSPASNWTSTTPPNPAQQCDAAVLQVDLVPASGWTSQSQLESDTQTVFLEPQSSNGPATNKFVNGSIIKPICGAGSNGRYSCFAILNTLPTSPAYASCSASHCYYLHIVPIYQITDLSVTAYSALNGNSTNQLDLTDAQALIDSTGKASDQLKRIQERVAINPVGSNDVPADSLESLNGICKQLTTRPGVTTGNTTTC